MYGSYTGVNIATSISKILAYFGIRDNFGHAIADNASENTACLNHLSELLNIDLDKRRVMCMGHVINLVAQEVLFGSDIDTFELELTNVTTEELELLNWRKRGPIGKLHNLIRHICHSSKRRDLFKSIQVIQYQSLHGSDPSAAPIIVTYDLVHDNLTRWNSWHDAAVRALKLRTTIEEFIDAELGDYNAAMARYNSSRSQAKRLPKKPSLLADVLNADDWAIIMEYVAILKLCKEATMLLQGHVSTTIANEKSVTGAIWQVLPIFDSLLTAFENARERHLPLESLRASQPTFDEPSAPSSPSTITTPTPVRITRSSQSIPIPRTLASTDSSAAQNATVAADEQTTPTLDAEKLESQKHFCTNINLAWQKLDKYHFKTDEPPIYRAAVVLHPRLKWRWFDKYWEHKPQWRKDAKTAVASLWAEYKDKPVDYQHSVLTSSPLAIRDEWSSDDAYDGVVDQFQAYINEPFALVLQEQSPIPYWISKLTVWPQLAQIALDIYSTPACSDEPERVFSKGSNLLQ
jgi:hypothetical protein